MIRYKLLHPDAKAPVYGSDEAAGADLCAIETVWLNSYRIRLVRTGVSIELPKGYEAQVRPRSGLALKHGVTVINSPGTIDSDYRGEIAVIMTLIGRDPDVIFEIKPGDRIAQLVIAPVVRATFGFVGDEELSGSERGTGGFGSTGVN
ncbi:dUTP diphosphatase [Mesorhizobium sp. M7A.F.Ca.CA.002.12.1.1]|uniref:dUTP diphosphatase n=1 Tax=Mesorhizobium sp. M7A.F.Ca.CA.002.12.1.1 TaxID=2496735 RepID=UPI001FE113F9|nr:dUTP diphosphatase [Mesorhizobium sp. M7A.F.Ca.CA.002.12.1.1]